MNYDLDPELRTVGHMMRELGYYTAYKGKWHLTRRSISRSLVNR